jgi:hypothetical protein
VLGASRLPLFIVRPREIEAQEHRLGEETRPRWLSQLGV